MKRPWIVLIALAALPAVGGCFANKAALEGHDAFDTGLATLAAGIGEYHADEAQGQQKLRTFLAGEFAADIVALTAQGAEKAAVQKKVQTFMEALTKADAAAGVERERYGNLQGTLRALSEINGSLRDLTTIKLGWQSEAVEYARKLRERIAAASRKEAP